MPEWLNGTVSKTVERKNAPRVQIPPSPLQQIQNGCKYFQRVQDVIKTIKQSGHTL